MAAHRTSLFTYGFVISACSGAMSLPARLARRRRLQLSKVHRGAPRGRFEQLEPRALLDASWGQLNGGQLAAANGIYTDATKWWDTSTQPPTALGRLPTFGDNVAFTAPGNSSIAVPNNQSVLNLTVQSGTAAVQTTLTLSQRLSVGVFVEISPNGPQNQAALTVTSATGQRGSVASGMVRLVDQNGLNGNDSLTLQNVTWLIPGALGPPGGAALVIDAKQAQVTVSQNSRFYAGAREITVAPTYNGTLTVDNSSVSSTSKLDAGTANPASGAAAQTAQVTAQNNATISVADLDLYHGAQLTVTSGSQVKISDPDQPLASGFLYANTGSVSISGGSTAVTVTRTATVVQGVVTVTGGSKLKVGSSASFAQDTDATFESGAQLSVGRYLLLNKSTVTLSGAGTSASSYGVSLKGSDSPKDPSVLVVDSGARLTTTSITDGSNVIANASSEVDINAGGTWSSSSGIYVGDRGKATLNVTGTGNLTSTGLNIIGQNSLADIAGTWTISNGNFNSAKLQVDAGTLQVTGTVTTVGTVETTEGGIIRGNGTVNSNVDASDGTVQPGRTAAGPALGTLTISGNANLAGELDIDVFDGNTCDLLKVNGTATLTNGRLVVDFIGNAPPAPNTHLVVLNATGGRNGTKFFTTPEGKALGNGLVLHVDYSNPNEVILDFVAAVSVNISPNPTDGTSFTSAIATLVGIGEAQESLISVLVDYGDGTTSLIDNTSGTAHIRQHFVLHRRRQHHRHRQRHPHLQYQRSAPRFCRFHNLQHRRHSNRHRRVVGRCCVADGRFADVR